MKFIITILLLVPSLVFSKPYLFVNVHYCNSDLYGKLKQVKVLRNGVYLPALSDSLEGKSFAILKNIDTGYYQFLYLNSYKKEVQESILFSENGPHEINICLDKLGDIAEGFRGLIDSISISTPLLISVKTAGCFGGSQCELKISLKNDKYFVSYINTIKSEGERTKKIHKTKRLNKNEIQLIRLFEYELGMIEYYTNNSNIKEVCTTRSVYELKLSTIRKTVYNTSCS